MIRYYVERYIASRDTWMRSPTFERMEDAEEYRESVWDGEGFITAYEI